MTKLVEWSDSLSVGIDEIDAQHRVLVNLVNEMHQAIEQGRGSEAVGAVLTRLGEYTRIHFAVEESLMRLLGYPDLERHKEEHAELMTRLQELRQRFESGSSALDGDLMSLLKVWLTRHIMESDQQYAQFFVESGLSSRQRRRASRTRAWDHLHG